MGVLERRVEQALKDSIREMGGEALKWVSPGKASVPDRVCLLPGGRVLLVEAKTQTGRLSPGQKRFMEQIVDRSQTPAAVVHGVRDVAAMLADYAEWVDGGEAGVFRWGF